MDKKHDGHVWCKANTTNIKNNFNLTFQNARCLGHLQCQNYGYDFFLLNKCKNKIAWNGNIVHDLKGLVLLPVRLFAKFIIMPIYV